MFVPALLLPVMSVSNCQDFDCISLGFCVFISPGISFPSRQTSLPLVHVLLLPCLLISFLSSYLY